VGDVVHDPISTHGRHHVETVCDRLRGQLPGVLGGLRPRRLDVILTSENPCNCTVATAGELRRGRIGHEEESLHLHYTLPG
jgi:hypothetical protein